MSGAHPQLRIVYAYLETLHSNARTAASMLTECSSLSKLDFSPNHEVTQAYDRYLDRWSEHRKILQESLDAIAEAFKTTLDSFQTIEAELINALDASTNH